jgi:2-polyprenyl-3-methyl-5-hydroxy-6-metoxy-1,4-benzoquinol methylase
MEQSINTMERIHLTKEQLDNIEQDIRFNEHIKRYASVRRYCYGKVLDFASGCGYGSYVISKNPDVTSVVGVDADTQATTWSIEHFSNAKTKFIQTTAPHVKLKFDTLLCLETIEHVEKPQEIYELVERCEINNLIISFPDKKSTHFNPYHLHDFVLQDLCDMFDKHVVYKSFRTVDVQFVLMMRLPDNAPSHIFRNIKDI